ncbi:MAG: hypothetical protein JKY54_16115 [Flavobacteriales bacterium]|nr:hypothetical protein [Flavobacteriales bacterium]
MGYLSNSKLDELGISYGKNVLVSDKASIYGGSNIVIGDNVRIDDFCILSGVNGYINLHSHIHVAAFVSMFGAAGIVMEDFTAISSYSVIYSVSDNYDGNSLIGPVMDEDCLDIIKGEVKIRKYASCGTHSVLLPGVIMNEGSILGACSLANRNLDEWSIYVGTPAKKNKKRDNGLLDKSHLMIERWKKR